MNALFRCARQPRTWWTLLGTWWVTLWFLSGSPSPPQLPGFLDWDKLKHVVYFMLGGMFWALALGLKQRPMRPWLIALSGALFCSLVGILDEWHQVFTPGRTGADWGDWIADSIGGLIGPWIGLASRAMLRVRT